MGKFYTYPWFPRQSHHHRTWHELRTKGSVWTRSGNYNNQHPAPTEQQWSTHRPPPRGWIFLKLRWKPCLGTLIFGLAFWALCTQITYTRSRVLIVGSKWLKSPIRDPHVDLVLYPFTSQLDTSYLIEDNIYKNFVGGSNFLCTTGIQKSFKLLTNPVRVGSVH